MKEANEQQAEKPRSADCICDLSYLDIIAEFMPKDNRKKIMRIGTIFARPCKKLEQALSYCLQRRS